MRYQYFQVMRRKIGCHHQLLPHPAKENIRMTGNGRIHDAIGTKFQQLPHCAKRLFGHGRYFGINDNQHNIRDFSVQHLLQIVLS